jgi:hypothetical protein
MSIRKIVLYAFTVLVSSLAFGLLFTQQAHAQGEEWYWDGQDIIVFGGIFGGTKDSPVKFTLEDANSNRYEQSGTVSGDPPGTAVKGKIQEGGGRGGGAVKVIDDCVLKEQMSITVNGNSVAFNTTRGGPNNGWSLIGKGVRNSDGKGCFVHGDQTPSISTQLKGVRDRPASETGQADALDRLREQKKEEYLTRECPTPQSPDLNRQCREKAAGDFDAAWAGCSPEAASAASGPAKEAAMNNCLQRTIEVGLEPGSTTGFEVPDYEKEPEDCDIKGIGYIVCPLMRFMASLTDSAWNVVQHFLTVKPLDTGSAAYDAWKALRNIANVAFVIAFMIIVYSQLTGGGLNNYNIKRLLPRIIVAAILMNTSYFLCSIAIDFSNIAGDSIQKVLVNFAQTVGYGQGVTNTTWGSLTSLTGGVLVFAAGSVVAIYATIAMAVPLLTTVLIALTVTALVLVARYAIIIILVVISPLAFVAYLLPNTQKWFSKWSNTFITMLMLYPLIALLYGGSTLAANTVYASSTSNGIASAIIPLAIQTLPLLLTPFLVKFAGGILSRFGAVVNSRGPLNKIQKKADNYAAVKKTEHDFKALNNIGPNKRTGLRGLRDSAVQRRYKRQAVREGLKGENQAAEANYVRDYMTGEKGSGGEKKSLNPLQRIQGNETRADAYLNDISRGGATDDALNQAIQAKSSMHVNEVNAIKARISHASGTTFESIKEMAKLGKDGTRDLSAAEREAAIDLTIESGDIGDLHDLMKASGSMKTVEQRAKLIKAMQQNGGTPYMADPAVQNSVMQGQVTAANFSQTVIAPSIHSGDWSASNISTLHPAAAKELSDAVSSGSVGDTAALTNLKQSARQALDSTHTNNNILGSSLPHIETLAGPATNNRGAPRMNDPRVQNLRDQFRRNRGS